MNQQQQQECEILSDCVRLCNIADICISILNIVQILRYLLIAHRREPIQEDRKDMKLQALKT